MLDVLIFSKAYPRICYFALASYDAEGTRGAWSCLGQPLQDYEIFGSSVSLRRGEDMHDMSVSKVIPSRHFNFYRYRAPAYAAVMDLKDHPLVHRSVLSAASPVLQRMFESSMQEGLQREVAIGGGGNAAACSAERRPPA